MWRSATGFRIDSPQRLPKEIYSGFQEIPLSDPNYVAPEEGSYNSRPSWVKEASSLQSRREKTSVYSILLFQVTPPDIAEGWYVFGRPQGFLLKWSHSRRSPHIDPRWFQLLTNEVQLAAPLPPHPLSSPILLNELLAKKAGAELNNIAVERLFSSKTKKTMTVFYLYVQCFDSKQ